MDELFLRFVRGLFIIMVLFGAGMIVVILFGNESIGLKMVSSFGSMFAGILGLGSGYLLGRSERQSQENEERRPHDST
jgi:hypothetical protein